MRQSLPDLNRLSQGDPSAPILERSPPRYDRRAFLLGALFAGQSIMVAATTQAQRSRSFFREFNPFAPLDDANVFDLVATYTETPVPLTEDEPDADGRRTFRFSLTRATPVFLTATAASSEQVFVHPLIVRPQDGPRLLLPLIQSAQQNREIPSTIQLGTFESGDHTFTLEQDAALTLPIPSSLVLRATHPEPDALLGKFLAHTPVIEVKNGANPLDDIPLMAFAKIYRRGDEYKVTSFVIFSSENGGTMPARLLDVYQRTLDIEWVTQQLYAPTGDPVPGRLSFQTIHHGFERFEGRRILGEHPLLSIASQNNNFSDGMFRVLGWAFPRPSERVGSDSILYAPKPRFLLADDWGTSLLSEFPEMQRWSLFELTLEGCVMDNGRVDPGEAQFFADLGVIQQHLTVTFPHRGCQRRLSVIDDDE
jgi:hypothetical protein